MGSGILAFVSALMKGLRKGGFARYRVVVGVVALLLAVATYALFVGGPDKPFPPIYWPRPQFPFFSGNSGGFYTQIGSILERRSEQSPIAITRVETAGGFENAILVLNTPGSFGLVQEDTVPEGDFIRSKLQYVTPLYLERMHVLYRTSSLEAIPCPESARNCDPANAKVSLDDQRIREFFAKARVNTGPTGSSTQVFASYVLGELNVTPAAEETSEPAKSYAELEAGNLDVAFMMAGAPLRELRELFQRTNEIRLMSVDAAFISSMNRTHRVHFRPTGFRGKYKQENEEVTTFGSYAFLIASPDVPEYATDALVKLLHDSKEFLRPGDDLVGQLEEFRFWENTREGLQASRESQREKVGLFLAVVLPLTGVLIALVLVAVSSWKHAAQCERILELRQAFQGANGLQQLQGLAGALQKARANAHADYADGELLSSHHQDLLAELSDARDDFEQRMIRFLVRDLGSDEHRLARKAEECFLQELLSWNGLQSLLNSLPGRRVRPVAPHRPQAFDEHPSS